jgi:hypothetical protein
VARLERRPGRKKIRRKIRTDDVQTAEEAAMSVTYYVAFPFFGPRTVPRRAKHRSVKAKATAIKGRRNVTGSNAGAVAFKRAGDPNVGEFSDAVVLKKFGDVPEDLSAL